MCFHHKENGTVRLNSSYMHYVHHSEAHLILGWNNPEALSRSRERSRDQMMERFATSPRLRARIAGVFYLLTMLTGAFAQGFVSGRLVVEGDSVATATNMLTHRGLFQLGFAVYLIEMSCNIAMTALFYDLYKPVSRSLSLLA